MARKKVLILGIGDRTQGSRCAEIAKDFLNGSGRYRATVVNEAAVAAKKLPSFDAVMVHAAAAGTMTAELEAPLVRFVKSGKGLVGVHSAANAFEGAPALHDLVGCRLRKELTRGEFLVKVAAEDHQATKRLGDFVANDSPYDVEHLASDASVLATTDWLGRALPVMYARTAGRGRVFYTTLGAGEEQFGHACFRKSLLHGLDWTCRVKEAKAPIRCAMLGYGGAFGMGKIHSSQINDTPGLRAVAACDKDPARTRQAKADFPTFKTYTSLEAMLKDKSIDLVVNILPHDLHAQTTLQCLRAGKHIVSEKPFCLTVKQADAMIRAAARNRVMLTVYHNRRWDGDYLTIRRLVAAGTIGEIFEIDCGFSGYGRPREWWRSDKEISGGNLYDWGAHFVDWVLGLILEPIVSVNGFFHKRVWMHVTNEDHTQAIVRFANGAKADVTISSISAVPRPRWRILGTRGGIVHDGTVGKAFKVFTYEDGQLVTRIVPFGESKHHEFYWNVADHLLLGDELAVKPAEARRAIGVIECAERSSKSGRGEVFPGEAG